MEILANPKCPECNSNRLYKDGIRYLADGSSIQRWLCRNCGYRFSQPNVKINIATKSAKLLNPSANLTEKMISSTKFPFQKGFNSSFLFGCEDIRSQDSKPHITKIGKSLNTFPHYNSDGEYAVKEKQPKNSPRTLVLNQTVETKSELSAGATEKADIKGKILEFLWQLKKEGLEDQSIKTYDTVLKLLMKSCGNLEPESVKEVLAKKKWSENTKVLVSMAYSRFLEFQGRTWEAPKYRITRKIPYVPLESELDTLICGARKKLTTFLRLLKETGLRSGEAWRLKWIDIDFEKQILTLNDPEKHGTPRILKLSSTLIAMFKAIQTESERIFNGDLRAFRVLFRKYRNRMSVKLKNPKLQRITFHSFRHWKATIEYHRTKDILYVKETLGHKNINTTLLYTQLVNFESDEWHSATAKTTEEAKKLIEAGFEFICTTPEEIMLFRKRK